MRSHSMVGWSDFVTCAPARCVGLKLYRNVLVNFILDARFLHIINLHFFCIAFCLRRKKKTILYTPVVNSPIQGYGPEIYPLPPPPLNLMCQFCPNHGYWQGENVRSGRENPVKTVIRTSNLSGAPVRLYDRPCSWFTVSAVSAVSIIPVCTEHDDLCLAPPTDRSAPPHMTSPHQRPVKLTADQWWSEGSELGHP